MLTKKLSLLCALCFSGWVGTLLSAEKPAAADVLLEIAESYYDYDLAGLNRISCYVKSPEILAGLDYSARKAVGGTKYETVIVPGKSIEVKMQDVSSKHGPDVRGSMLAFSKKMERWLNTLMTHLVTFPKAIHPKKDLDGYDIQWIEGEEGKKMTLKRVSKVMGAEQNDNKPRGSQGPMRSQMKNVRKNIQKNFQKSKKRGARVAAIAKQAGAGQIQIPDAEVNIDLHGDSLEVHLDRSGKISMLLIEKDDQRQEVRVKTKSLGKRWVLEHLDSATFDDQDRLIERNLIRYNYTSKSGIPVVRKITLNSVDAKGKLIDRRDDPNPVSVELSSHMVDIRK